MKIDWWTLALQTVNVLILIWLLGRYLFRPVADIVAQRQEEANKLLTDAAAARQQVDWARSEIDRARADVAAERDMLIADARTAAETERTALLARAKEEVAKLKAEADAAISRDRVAMEKMLINRTRALSVEIALRLLGRVPPATAMEVFLVGLCQQVRALPSQARAAFTSTAEDNGVVEVVTAAVLDNDEAERIRRALIETLGSKPALVFRCDPEMMAGIELHSRHTVVRNSWRGDIDRIREELNRDDE